MPSPQDLCSQAETFASKYVSLWSSTQSSSADHSPAVARRVADHYRPGFTFFTNGKIARFETQDEAASLIESELRAAIAAGLGACMTLKDVRAETISDNAALCWITFSFHPAAASGLKDWSFKNLYGYRVESQGLAAGWEFVVRDEEANEMQKVADGVFHA